MPNAISNAILNLSASLDYEQHLSELGAVMENHYNWSDWPFEAKKIIHKKKILSCVLV